MSAHIRLTRTGKKKRPSYRIIVVDSRAKRDGAYIENLGFYQPIEGEGISKIDLERYSDWVKQGAKVSDVVFNIVKKIKKAG